MGVGRRLEDDGKFHLPGVPPAFPLFPFASLQTARAHTVKAAQKRPQLRTESDIIGREVEGEVGLAARRQFEKRFPFFRPSLL